MTTTELLERYLFRGRRIDNQEWVYGYYIATNATHYIVYDSQYDDDLLLTPENICISVDPATVGQYIQKRDKHKTKIFDGDIVRTKYGRLCRVIWFEPKACWDLTPIETPGNIDLKAPEAWDMWDSCNLEVCGSIHDRKDGNK